MSEVNINPTKLQKLKLEHNRLSEDLKEILKELNYAKKSLNQTQNVTLVDDLINHRRTTNKVLTIPENKPSKKTSLQSRLALYEYTSGIHVENITMEYYPTHNPDQTVTNTFYNKFEVDANINRLGFHVMYVTNQDIEACFNDKITSYDVKELNIKMNKQIHQVELQQSLDYFSRHPSKIALAFICLRDYNRLFNERQRIGRKIAKENPELIECDLIVEDSELGYLEINATSNVAERDYFHIKWCISWDEKKYSVKDYFKVTVPYEDETYIESISHNFKKLCSSEHITNTALLQDTEEINNIVKSKPKTEEEKLSLLRNAMKAVKAAEHE